MNDARGRIEEVARLSYGRLVAYLAAQTRDVAAAEDALGDALLAALATWPVDGVPATPEAWLLTAARRRLLDLARHTRVRDDHAETLRLIAAQSAAAKPVAVFPDERLKLLFVCAHPAIDPSLHTPLMLQTVLGLDAVRVARAFLVSPAAMRQRLVRVKTKIREAGIPFEVPDERELPQRLEAVLEAIYAAFGLAWDEAAGAGGRGRELEDEAIWLARSLRQLLPDEPEIRGLLALMLFCKSRGPARRTADGRYVPLAEQDPRMWLLPEIVAAEAELAEAAKRARPGRFQLEAAIQSVHAERRRTGRTHWPAIALFYSHLVELGPSLGARVAQAAAIAETEGSGAALALLDRIEAADVADYQPYWAVRAHLLQLARRDDEARAAFDRAIGLTDDAALRRFLLERRR
jgi:RNA polymerase sigma-70 factor (ECF subfamily)